MAKAKRPKQVTALKHDDAKRPNIPTAELQPVMTPDAQSPIEVAYERRNRDLDPQLVWSGKDHLDAAGLSVQAPPLFIQEKVHPQVLIRDLMRSSGQGSVGSDQEGVATDHRPPATQIRFADLFADFNGLEGDAAAKTEFYQHDANWTNRMILGDSLQVMASLAEREGLRGKVQCIYIDPPYGIKFNSNFQWSTTSRDVRDGKAEHITREPEQVKAFRDTWRHGIHSYLSYLRDRLEVARDLLSESGSVFVQIGEENVHQRPRRDGRSLRRATTSCTLDLVKKKGRAEGVDTSCQSSSTTTLFGTSAISSVARVKTRSLFRAIRGRG